MIYRDITERVPKAAPFLRFDADPYAAIVDGPAGVDLGRLHADRPVPLLGLHRARPRRPHRPIQEGAPQLVGEANYMRNSVKVVVDGYDGSISYFVADPEDPIIQAWSGAFPSLFTPIEEAPTELLEHFRYPENLFQIQAVQYTNYHVTDPDVFYGKQDFWAIPVDPTVSSETSPDRDAPVLPADAPAGRGGGVLRSDPSVHPSEPTEHGRVDGGEVRPRTGLRAARQLPVPGRCQRRRADPGLLAHQPGRALLRRTHPARPGRIVDRVRGLPRDPVWRTRCSTSNRSTSSPTSRTRSRSSGASWW